VPAEGERIANAEATRGGMFQQIVEAITSAAKILCLISAMTLLRSLTAGNPYGCDGNHI
jgi:hypothetical protein